MTRDTAGPGRFTGATRGDGGLNGAQHESASADDSALWTAGASVGAVASAALLVVFFHPWLLLGVLIDAAVLWAVLIARWEPSP
jgi:hypothetical protein